MTDYAAARLNMVESQLRTNKVTNEALLDAFLAVPRERFVPPALRGTAYIDEDLPLGNGRYLLEPMVFARLVQLAAVGPQDTVLEIGCGSGYGTAILARLARAVVGIDCDQQFAAQAAARLRELAIGNANVVEAPLAAGFPNRAPYSVILFEGAVAAIPEAVSRQLGEGGRLVAVVRPGEGVGRATLVVRTNGVIAHRTSFDAAAPFLPGFQPTPSFVF
ncbi:MAG TPA: protein-L-isoaspartate O-methyltransferase [Stellaceae bacterium]|nr:protein-L-isoaspartate O-methyltransferase [Stellaceae bacterium]